ncbi:MAG: membrane protease subunit HflK [Parasphingorhabdus sp.]|jgi:membrane protease subunit HflK
MPWNQPGSGNNKDPWGQGNGNGNGQGQGQSGPPDLDEVLRNIRSKFGGSGGSSGGSSGNVSMPGKAGIALILVILVGIWGALGFYVVEEGERAVVLRFGKYLDSKGAGLRWVPKGIESATVINTQRINTVEVGYRENTRTNQNTEVPKEALMLTTDENIIDIKFAVQFDISNPEQLLFNVSEPMDTVVRQATESAVREIVGRNSMDFIITDGRAQIAAETRSLLQAILDRYETGINITTVEMQNAQPPAQVKPAFDDAVKAREDKERLKNEAQAYANDVIPRARGHSSRVIQEAEGYRASTVAKAEGEASRFDQVLTEYKLAPSITRDRLYLESMEKVYTNSTKLLIDQKEGGNSVMYLPLDQLIKERNRQYDSGSASPSSTSIGTDFQGSGLDRDINRGVRTDRLSSTRQSRG